MINGRNTCAGKVGKWTFLILADCQKVGVRFLLDAN
jgi:hypothetical protein